MLWYKGWLETRFRLLFILAVMGLTVFMQESSRRAHPVSAGKPAMTSFVTLMFIEVVLVGAIFGGAGIATQPSFTAQRGVHGSTLFTLSLPVSRRRLLLVRAALGWLEAIAAMTLFCAAMWFALPWLRTAMTGFEMVEYLAALLACGSVFYCVAVLLGSFLDDQWRVWGTMLVAGAFGFASMRLHLPAFADIFRGMSQLITAHAMPWSVMAFSLGLAALLLAVTARIVQRREY
ncbi:MAG TPA: hypothetical protein VHU44_03280 [Acidobacteriaceae bacterium]|jgi:hypothetical protein|nr:hypothetical protein [Acidobacteriaceae bacterium]